MHFEAFKGSLSTCVCVCVCVRACAVCVSNISLRCGVGFKHPSIQACVTHLQFMWVTHLVCVHISMCNASAHIFTTTRFTPSITASPLILFRPLTYDCLGALAHALPAIHVPSWLSFFLTRLSDPWAPGDVQAQEAKVVVVLTGRLSQEAGRCMRHYWGAII